ncbi:hypothetical protein CEXT_120641 [Caerostris extrusa]|uniref:Uncharacterized protein n=1 Tax=Caerostris extrusa TaxID=172846 RepID=A0AAV4X2E8_CAEEX|nr:hypothetical protein CEXT_120641 [Caerostris extrusa]
MRLHNPSHLFADSEQITAERGHHGRLSAPTDWRRKDHPRDTTPPHSFQLIRHRHSIKSQKACEPEQTVYTPGSTLRGNSHRGAELLNGVGSCQVRPQADRAHTRRSAPTTRHT